MNNYQLLSFFGMLKRSPPENIFECRCAEEVLLLEPEFLSAEIVVVGIENFRNVLGQIFLENCFDIVAVVEEAEVEVARRHGRPQSQRVNHVVAVAGDRRVVRHG